MFRINICKIDEACAFRCPVLIPLSLSKGFDMTMIHFAGSEAYFSVRVEARHGFSFRVDVRQLACFSDTLISGNNGTQQNARIGG